MSLDIVDIHTHLWPPAWGPGGSRQKPTAGLSPDVYRKLTDQRVLLEEFAAAGVNTAVLSATIESLFGMTGPTDSGAIRATNDWLADLVAANPRRLAAFATIDAFAPGAAKEAERAITRGGLAGLVIDSAREGRFLADPAVQPVLEVAQSLKVPVFVHPVAHPDPEPLIAAAGAWGNSLGRGLMNGVALLSLLNSGTLETLPDLHIVFATLGLGAIVQAARGGVFGRDAWESGSRPNVYFDTMGHDPRIIRVLTGYFGAARVLAGTDWPILPALAASSLPGSLAKAGLTPPEQALVAGGNARRLLALRRVK